MNIELNKQLALTIRGLYFSMTEQWAAVSKEHSLSSAQQHILYILSSSDEPLSETEISHLGRWHKSTVTRLLQPLISNEYISITNAKRKFKFVQLTENGKAKLRAIADDVFKRVNFPLNTEGLEDEDVSQFVEIGLRILRNQPGEAFATWVKESHPKQIF